MIEVVNIIVRSYSVEYLDISWEIKDTQDNVRDYDFYVLRSMSPEGPFDVIAGPFVDFYMFRDSTVPKTTPNRVWYYKIRTVKRDTGEEKDWGNTFYMRPATQNAPADLYAKEMSRRMNLLLSEFIGRKYILYKIRTFGQRCPTCWDPIKKAKRLSYCVDCFGTGFAGGYHSPMIIHLQLDPAPESVQTLGDQETLQKNTTARCSNYPPLTFRDVLISPENERWRVSQVSTTTKLGAVVHQNLTLHLIPRTDIEYRLPVNAEYFQASPEREFINPENLNVLSTEGVLPS